MSRENLAPQMPLGTPYKERASRCRILRHIAAVLRWTDIRTWSETFQNMQRSSERMNAVQRYRVSPTAVSRVVFIPKSCFCRIAPTVFLCVSCPLVWDSVLFYLSSRDLFNIPDQNRETRQGTADCHVRIPMLQLLR